MARNPQGCLCDHERIQTLQEAQAGGGRGSPHRGKMGKRMIRKPNHWLEVTQDEEGGKHVLARRPLAPGDIVFRLPKVFTDTRDRHSIEVGPGKHQAYTDDLDDYINHSCDPNLELVVLDATADEYGFRAVKPIEAGEEVSWDYETFETSLSSPFPCTCGAVNCRGRIEGRKQR
jgi:uncharacterized protein